MILNSVFINSKMILRFGTTRCEAMSDESASFWIFYYLDIRTVAMCRDDNATRNALYSCARRITIQPPDLSTSMKSLCCICLLCVVRNSWNTKKCTSFEHSSLDACSCCTSISMHQTIIFISAFALTCTNEMKCHRFVPKNIQSLMPFGNFPNKFEVFLLCR